MMMLENQSVMLRVPCLHALSDAQRAIVESLHGVEGTDISQLCAALGVTSSAVRAHLANLEEAGLVKADIERGGAPGRPKHLHRLTEKAQALFSQHADHDDAQFTQAVLQEIRRRHPSLVANVVRELSGAPGWAKQRENARDITRTRVAASAS